MHWSSSWWWWFLAALSGGLLLIMISSKILTPHIPKKTHSAKQVIRISCAIRAQEALKASIMSADNFVCFVRSAEEVCRLVLL